jgi:NADPH:quinone reductase-like Zn-dependent oxidoreductase
MPKTLLCDWIDGRPRLVLRELPVAQPGPGEVRYRVQAIGINRADVLYMHGEHYTPSVFPVRLGYEACGIVDAVGAGVVEFKAGDRVSAIPFGDPKYCVAGESAITPARFLAPWPAGYSPEEAAATWMQYMTAYFPLKEVSTVATGDTVLITAASSSAGLGAIQLAKYLGARVIATTRSADKKDFLLRAGADCVVAADEGEVSARILEFTDNRGVQVVYDAVAGSFMGQYAEAVARKGRIFVYGALGGAATIECPILPLIRKGATIELYSLINYLQEPGAVERGRDFIWNAIRVGAFRPIVDRVFDLELAAEAYAYMEAGAQKGKIVLRCPGARQQSNSQRLQ